MFWDLDSSLISRSVFLIVVDIMKTFAIITSCLLCCGTRLDKVQLRRGINFDLPSDSFINKLSLQYLSSSIMHIKALSSVQHRHVAQAVYEYWHSSRSMFRAKSIEVLRLLRAGQTDRFRNYVSELVRVFLLF